MKKLVCESLEEFLTGELNESLKIVAEDLEEAEKIKGKSLISKEEHDSYKSKASDSPFHGRDPDSKASAQRYLDSIKNPKVKTHGSLAAKAKKAGEDKKEGPVAKKKRRFLLKHKKN